MTNARKKKLEASQRALLEESSQFHQALTLFKNKKERESLSQLILQEREVFETDKNNLKMELHKLERYHTCFSFKKTRTGT